MQYHNALRAFGMSSYAFNAGTGWYSWDAIDNGGTPSALSIVPELQIVAPGDPNTPPRFSTCA